MKELLQEDVYNNVVMDDVAAKLSSISTNATKIAEEDNVVDVEDDPVLACSIRTSSLFLNCLNIGLSLDLDDTFSYKSCIVEIS